MKSQVLLTVWCTISGEATGEIWHWSLSGVKGLNVPIRNMTFAKFLMHFQISSHSMKNLFFFSSLLGWNMIILPTLTPRTDTLLSEMIGECTFLTWEWKGKERCQHISPIVGICSKSKVTNSSNSIFCTCRGGCAAYVRLAFSMTCGIAASVALVMVALFSKPRIVCHVQGKPYIGLRDSRLLREKEHDRQIFVVRWWNSKCLQLRPEEEKHTQ